MTNKQRLQRDLLSNIKFTGALGVLTLLLFAYKLYTIFWADVTRIDINSKLIFGDYFVFTLFIVSIIAFIVSILLYKVLPDKRVQTQHTTLLVAGVLLLPYSLLLLVSGLKIGINNSRYESKNMIFGFIATLAFIIFYGFLLVGFAEIEPNYVESTTYEFEYRFDELNNITMTIEVVYQDDELLFVDIDAIANVQELTEQEATLNRLAYVLEGSNARGANRLCLEIVSEGEEIINGEYSCRTTLEDYPALILEDVDSWEDFMLLAIYQDIEFAFDYEFLNITLINQTTKENYYE